MSSKLDIGRDQLPPSEIVFGDIGCWGAAREDWGYSANPIVSGEYRDADRAGDCDAFNALKI